LAPRDQPRNKPLDKKTRTATSMLYVLTLGAVVNWSA
jgi:hypothetical protein